MLQFTLEVPWHVSAASQKRLGTPLHGEYAASLFSMDGTSIGTELVEQAGSQARKTGENPVDFQNKRPRADSQL